MNIAYNRNHIYINIYIYIYTYLNQYIDQYLLLHNKIN